MLISIVTQTVAIDIIAFVLKLRRLILFLRNLGESYRYIAANSIVCTVFARFIVRKIVFSLFLPYNCIKTSIYCADDTSLKYIKLSDKLR